MKECFLYVWLIFYTNTFSLLLLLHTFRNKKIREQFVLRGLEDHHLFLHDCVLVLVEKPLTLVLDLQLSSLNCPNSVLIELPDQQSAAREKQFETILAQRNVPTSCTCHTVYQPRTCRILSASAIRTPITRVIKWKSKICCLNISMPVSEQFFYGNCRK